MIPDDVVLISIICHYVYFDKFSTESVFENGKGKTDNKPSFCTKQSGASHSLSDTNDFVSFVRFKCVSNVHLQYCQSLASSAIIKSIIHQLHHVGRTSRNEIEKSTNEWYYNVSIDHSPCMLIGWPYPCHKQLHHGSSSVQHIIESRGKDRSDSTWYGN